MVFLIIWVAAVIYLIECKQFNPDKVELEQEYHPRHRRQVSDLDYLRRIYAHFRHIFWGQGTTTRQFAVVTVGRLTQMPNTSATDFPLDHPYDYNAASYDHTRPIHTEPVLLETLSSMIIQFLHDTGRLPDSVYLYTYNIPCPRCTDDIVHYIENIFPNDLQNEVQHNPRYRAALQQIPHMTYRIGWTLEMVPDEAIATLDAFLDVDDDPSNSRLRMYRRIRL